MEFRVKVIRNRPRIEGSKKLKLIFLNAGQVKYNYAKIMQNQIFFRCH